MSGALRRGRLVGAALAVVLMAMLSAPTAAAASAEESFLLTLTNGVRATVGAPALVLDGPLSSIARQWAASMASQNNISHNPNLKDQIEAAGYTNWTRTGENVGMGPTVQLIQDALIKSPGHYKNIVEPAFQRVGIGIVVANGTVWVVVDFLTLGAAAPPPPPPAPAITSPAPAPAPATTKAPITTTPPPPSTTTTAPPPPPTTTTTIAPVTAPPAPTTSVPPPSSGLALQLALMLQQLKALNAPR